MTNDRIRENESGLPPGEGLVRSVDSFFDWAVAAYCEGRRDKKDFMDSAGYPMDDLSHWRGASWTNRADALAAQISSTEKLLAVLSYSGTHNRHVRKGRPAPARKANQWESYADIHARSQTLWEMHAQPVIGAVEIYLERLDTARLNSASAASLQASTVIGSAPLPARPSEGLFNQTRLEALAARLLSIYQGDFIPPNLRLVDAVDERFITRPGIDDPLASALPLTSIENLVDALTLSGRAIGATHFVVGAAGQGKSRLAAHVAAAILRIGRPCLLIRRQELERISKEVATIDAQGLVAKLALSFGLSDPKIDTLLSKQQIPIIIDGWNELEHRYAGSQLYNALVTIISGLTRYPVLVTSRRVWWESQEDIPFGRTFITYRLDHFEAGQRAKFVSGYDIDPQAMQTWLSVTGLSEICQRPFFLEQAVHLYLAEPTDGETKPHSRADLMQRSLLLRFRQVKSAVHQGAYPQKWPQGDQLAVATSLAAISNDGELIDPDVVTELLEGAFDSAPVGELVQAFMNLYLVDPLRGEVPDLFLYPHETLRDFGLALSWRDRALPDFALLTDEFEHVPGYWVGLQTEPDKAARDLLQRSTAADRPSVLADILSANFSRLSEDVRFEIWRALGDKLSGKRRALRDAAASALQDLPKSIRAQGVASGLLTGTRNRWPSVVEVARRLVLSSALSPEFWQTLTRYGERLEKDNSIRGERPQPEQKPDSPKSFQAYGGKSNVIRELRRLSVDPQIVSVVQDNPPQAVANLLISIGRDRSRLQELRAGAAIALGEIRASNATQFLHECLQAQEAEICAAAARAIGQIGDVSAIPTLRGLIGHTDPQIKFRVIVALGRLNVVEAGPEIERCLAHADVTVRSGAAHALGLLRRREAVPSMISMLNDGHSYVRGSVISALGRIGDRRARIGLEQRLNRL